MKDNRCKSLYEGGHCSRKYGRRACTDCRVFKRKDFQFVCHAAGTKSCRCKCKGCRKK